MDGASQTKHDAEDWDSAMRAVSVAVAVFALVVVVAVVVAVAVAVILGLYRCRNLRVGSRRLKVDVGTLRRRW